MATDSKISCWNAYISERGIAEYHYQQSEAAKKSARHWYERWAKLEYNCTCVHFNSELDIYTMADEIFSHRKTLDYSCLVSETLTADENCKICGGTGKHE